jgi:hypothetical protein
MLRSQTEVAWLQSRHISIEQVFSRLIDARFFIKCLNCYIPPTAYLLTFPLSHIASVFTQMLLEISSDKVFWLDSQGPDWAQIQWQA